MVGYIENKRNKKKIDDNCLYLKISRNNQSCKYDSPGNILFGENDDRGERK